MLAGLGAGLYRSLEDVADLSGTSSKFEPRMPGAERDAHLARWSAGLARTKSARSIGA
jgi:glycerol kinase